MNKFGEWLTIMETNTAEAADVVPSDQADARVQTLHALQQEHCEKLPAFQAIYDNVKRLTNGANAQEAERLNQVYTAIAARYRVRVVWNNVCFIYSS